MASSYPVQTRAVDPYASYNSNVVNQLTGIVTRGSNALDFYNSLQVIPDSTSAIDHVEVLPGIIYKDDMLIEITSSYRLDFDDLNSYIGITSSPISSIDGRYYVVLEYTYAKSRPAPIAYIKILVPAQTPSFRAGNMTGLFFLKAVDVASGAITDMYDYDPAYPDTRRIYLRNYASADIGLPTFDATRDQSRITYVPAEDQFYFGYSDRWGPAGGGSTFEIDTSGFALGYLVYVTAAGNLAKANGSFAVTTSDGAVVKVGVRGSVQTTGKVLTVPIEPGATANVGNIVYLSTTVSGTITNQKSTPFWQFVGRVVEAVDSTSVNVLYVRGEPNGIEGVELGVFGSATLGSGSWIPSGGSEYQDIDISGFQEDNVIVTLWDSTTEMKIEPENVEFIGASIMRIWMPSGYGGTVEAMYTGPPATTVASGTLAKVTDTLSGGDWNLSGGSYYADVDVSSINLSEAAIVSLWDGNDIVVPEDIQYDSTSVMKIWMPTNTETLDVVAIGPTNVASTIATITFELDSSGWVLDSGNYYQDVPISSLGTDEIVYDIKDTDSLERIVPLNVSIPTSGTLRIWVPANTYNLEVTVIG
jgi:hypothetical protein